MGIWQTVKSKLGKRDKTTPAVSQTAQPVDSVQSKQAKKQEMEAFLLKRHSEIEAKKKKTQQEALSKNAQRTAEIPLYQGNPFSEKESD